MYNLKGWWKEVGAIINDNQKDLPVQLAGQQHVSWMSFTNLSKLEITFCPKLTFMPLCPNVKDLALYGVNEALSVSKIAGSFVLSVGADRSSHIPTSSKLKRLSIDNVEDVISLPEECLQNISTLEVRDCKLQSTIRLREVSSSLSSLRVLEFVVCQSLRSLSEGLEPLTALEELVLFNCKELDLSPKEDQDNGMPWKAFTSLRSLTLHKMPKLVALPTGLQHLTNLRSLDITFNDELIALPGWISCFSSLEFMRLYRCPKLTSLPEGIRELFSLHELRITECPGLTERCRRPNGEDWPKIQHIPLVRFEQSPLERYSNPGELNI